MCIISHVHLHAPIVIIDQQRMYMQIKDATDEARAEWIKRGKDPINFSLENMTAIWRKEDLVCSLVNIIELVYTTRGESIRHDCTWIIRKYELYAFAPLLDGHRRQISRYPH